MHFHWIALKYFRETVRTKSIRKAAERLNVVPSAVNRQIINLEEQIGTPLFDRVPPGMRMTAAGEVFFRYVLTMQGDLDRALSEIDNLRGARRGHVTIACEEGLAKELLPEVVASFSASHAGVTFAILVEDMPSVVARVADGTADVGVAFNPDRDPRVQRQAEVSVVIGAVMHPKHPLATRSVLKLAELLNEPLIVPDLGYSIRQLFDGQFGGEGLALFRRVAETNSFEALSALVKAGLGIGLRSRVGIQAEIARGELTFIPILDRSFRSEKIAILVRSGRTLPAAAAVLTELLVGALAGLAVAAGQTESDEPTPIGRLPSPQTARRRARP
jgi:DNA-binding transcriptional LysR family regulator